MPKGPLPLYRFGTARIFSLCVSSRISLILQKIN
jgi:hypothetical protein